MITIESTPEFVASVYERMDRTLSAVRQRSGRPMGLAEKVLLAHLDDPSNTDLERGKSYVQLRPDRVILQDVLGQTAMLQFMQTRRAQTAVPTSVHCDHLTSPGICPTRHRSISGALHGLLREPERRRHPQP